MSSDKRPSESPSLTEQATSQKGTIMTVFEGKLVSENIKIGIVASRFNEFITSKLIGGAIDGLVRHNVREQDVDIAWVPGAFEAPLAAQKMAQTGRYDAVICLGAVIRGATTTWCAVKPPRASPTCRWKAACPSCSAS
jgi:hypothetical protein